MNKLGSWFSFKNITLLFLGFILLTFGYLGANEYKKSVLEKRREGVQAIINIYKDSLEPALVHHRGLVEGLERFVSQRSNKAIITDFPIFASGLHNSSAEVRNVGLAPGGVLTLIYPISGNEAALGYNLLADETPSVKEDITQTISSKKVIISEPFQLRQGGLGVAARKAIFKNHTLWGLASVVLDVPIIIANSGIKSEDQNQQIALRDDTGVVFWGNKDVFSSNPVIAQVKLGDSYWDLGGVPTGGWQKSATAMMDLYLALEVLFIAFVLIIVNYVWTNAQKVIESNLRWTGTLEAAKPALWYLFLGIVWILFSDQLLSFLLIDPVLITRISIIKGLGFILVTSLLFYIWTLRSFVRLETLLSFLYRIQRVAKLGYYVLDVKTGLWEGSEILKEIFGIDDRYKTNVAGWLEIVHPDQRHQMSVYFSKEVLAKKQPFDREYKIINQSSGDELWVHGVGQLEFDSEGDPLRMIGTIQDITEKKESEIKLKRLSDEILSEKQKMEAILRDMGDAVFVTDRKKKIIMVNKALELLFGLSREELLGKNIGEALTLSYESSGKKPIDILNSVFEKKIPAKPADIMVLNKKDGSRLLVDGIGSPITNENKKLVWTVWVFRDVTKERELDKMKTEFVSLASHQLRSPLTGIKWFIELLTSDKSKIPPEKVQEYLRNIGKSNERLIALVSDLLITSKIESGKVRKDQALCSLKSLIQNALDDQKTVLQDKKITVLGLEKIPPSLNVEVDEIQITQVFGNLINNAASYSPEGNQIELGAELQDGKVKILVKDYGFGIPAAQQAKIFNKFYRGDNVAKITSGSGLGLYVARSMVENHGGKIWFESGEGKGTTFFVELPLKQNNHPPSRE